MGQTAFHLMNYKINLYFGNFWFYFFKIPFKQWDGLSMYIIIDPSLKLYYNFSSNITFKKVADKLEERLEDSKKI